jgi:hypothetical protein
MKDMFEQGKQIDLKEYGVHAKLNGMPALDQVDSSIGAIQVYRSRPGACIIELVHNDRVANSMELAGEWELGNSCGRFEAGMPYNLLKIRVSLAINSNGRSNNTYDFDVNLNCWKSRNINDDLPYFIQMHMLFLTKSEGASLRMRLLADGNQIVTIPFEVPQTDVLKFLAYVVDSVNRLRFIAKQTNVDFGLFDIKEMCNANTIEFVYLLLAGNTPTLKNLVCNVTTESVGSTYREGTTYLWSVKFVQPMFPVLVLGKSIECGPVELMYDDAELLASSVTPTDVGQRVTWRISSSRSISVRRFNATDTVPVKSDASGAS